MKGSWFPQKLLILHGLLTLSALSHQDHNTREFAGSTDLSELVNSKDYQAGAAGYSDGLVSSIDLVRPVLLSVV